MTCPLHAAIVDAFFGRIVPSLSNRLTGQVNDGIGGSENFPESGVTAVAESASRCDPLRSAAAGPWYQSNRSRPLSRCSLRHSKPHFSIMKVAVMRTLLK